MANEGRVDIRGRIVLTQRTLQAFYEIWNLSGDDIFVLDAMFRLAGEAKLDPSLAYTVIEDDSLTLFRGVLRIPSGLQVEAPDIPFARRLRTGGAHQANIEMPLPLRFHQPYEWNDQEAVRATRKARLKIGYVAERDVNPVPSSRGVGGVEVYRFGYRQVIDVQHFLETSEQDLTVGIYVKP